MERRLEREICPGKPDKVVGPVGFTSKCFKHTPTVCKSTHGMVVYCRKGRSIPSPVGEMYNVSTV